MQNLQVIDEIRDVETDFVLFDLSEQTYAIELGSVVEIIKLLHLENPEKLPPEVIGVLKYSSYFINVVDLRNILDLAPERYTIENKIIIVATEETIMGLVIDSNLDIQKIPQSKIQPPPYQTENSYTRGLCTIDEKNIVILNLNSLENKVKGLFEKQDWGSNRENLFPDDPAALAILEERTCALHKRLQSEQLSIYEDNEKSITFEIGNEIFCLEISKIKAFYGLKSNTNITKVPCAPEFIIGLLNVKGDYIAVIDLSAYLNSGTTSITENSVVIILEAQDYKLGILVDKIGARMDILNEIEFGRKNASIETRPEIINFVKDDVVYSVLLIDELLKSDKLNM